MDLKTELSRSPRIVVADDDWLNRDLLETYLTNAGCEVSSYADGVGALEAIQESLPDMALLDIRMPRMDGLSVCRQVKDNPRTQFIPVIIVTALDAQPEELNAIESGADDFITKPFNPVILLTRVRSLLRLKQLHNELESRNELLRHTFHRYFDSEIADIILTDPERHLKLGGEIRDVTVLFADLRDFTRFSATHPAPQVVEILNLVFNELVEIVFNHKGTFDKFLGDAIMAFYGAPIGGEDDTQRAMRSALEMQVCFNRLRAEAKDHILDPLGLGIGLHSGEVIVGNIGSERVMDYTVIGDTANVARRLQESARAGEILISGATYQRVPTAGVKHLGSQAFPGRSDPVQIYALLDMGP
ncbi:MAG: response regulator [Anaerolineales bacterium]|nr:response regulator [Anaerolineales bacterium]